MLVTRHQASSTNEGDEDTLQSVEAKQRHQQAEERHSEAMRMTQWREEELRQQLEVLKAVGRVEPIVVAEAPTQPFWGQPFSRGIDETLIPPNFREIVVDPFDGTQDPHAYLQAF
ncbi:hypothetical protein CR513_29455, partial [Mucuna pruriens]